MLLRHHLERGLSKTAIADALGVSRRVIHHWIRTGQLDRDLSPDAAPRSRQRTQPTKLAAFEPLLRERLAQYPQLSAVRLLAEVRAETEQWLVTYNTQRPHDSLGGVPPLTFLPRPTLPAQSSYALSA